MEQPQYGYWLPPNISAHGAEIDRLLNMIHWFMLVLFVGWGIYLLYCLVRFRERAGHQSDINMKHFSFPKYIEIGIVLIEASLLVFFSAPIWAKVKTDFPNEKDALVVNIVAEQFAWNIHYPGRDGKFGKRKIELIDGTNPLGLDREDPDAKDDITMVNQLNIPVNKPVIVHLTAKDVIHSFSLPVMRVKQDIIPGMEIPIWFQANQIGEYEIACAQLCGLGHYRMRGAFTVMTQEDFDRFLAEEEKNLGGGDAAATPTESQPSGEHQ